MFILTKKDYDNQIFDGVGLCHGCTESETLRVWEKREPYDWTKVQSSSVTGGLHLTGFFINGIVILTTSFYWKLALGGVILFSVV